MKCICTYKGHKKQIFLQRSGKLEIYSGKISKTNAEDGIVTRTKYERFERFTNEVKLSIDIISAISAHLNALQEYVDSYFLEKMLMCNKSNSSSCRELMFSYYLMLLSVYFHHAVHFANRSILLRTITTCQVP